MANRFLSQPKHEGGQQNSVETELCHFYFGPKQLEFHIAHSSGAYKIHKAFAEGKVVGLQN